MKMELRLNLSADGKITVNNPEGNLQYNAELNLENYSAKIFDELSVSELMSIKSTEAGFTLTAFDSPLGSFSESDGEEFLVCSEENLKITQATGSFTLWHGDECDGTVTPCEGGFKLELVDTANMLLSVAEVLVIVIAKSFKSNVSGIEENKEMPSENGENADADEGDLAPDAVKWKIGSYVKPIFSKLFNKPQAGKTPLDGSLLVALFSVLMIAVVVVSAIMNANKQKVIENLSIAEARATSTTKAEFVIPPKTYQFDYESDLETPASGTASEYVKSDNARNFTVWYDFDEEGEINHFYTSEPSAKLSGIVRNISIVLLSLAVVVYFLSAFGIIVLPGILGLELKSCIKKLAKK